MTFTEHLANASDLASVALEAILPETVWAAWMVAHPLITLSIVAGLVIVLILLASFFFDFISDAWKIPFAVAVDVAKYLALGNPLFAYIAAAAGVVIFLILSDAGAAKWLFAIISAVAAALVLPYVAGGMVLGVLAAIIPINTVMMFIATIID